MFFLLQQFIFMLLKWSFIIKSYSSPTSPVQKAQLDINTNHTKIDKYKSYQDWSTLHYPFNVDKYSSQVDSLYLYIRPCMLSIYYDNNGHGIIFS